jgi:hypothetical protein
MYFPRFIFLLCCCVKAPFSCNISQPAIFPGDYVYLITFIYLFINFILLGNTFVKLVIIQNNNINSNNNKK